MKDNIEGMILIVDDKPDSVRVVETVLTKAGYQVSVATSGEKALDLISIITPDLILLDIMMPGIDGYETCRRLKVQEKTKDIPIIFLSALNDVYDKVKGFEQGAVDYLIKPIPPEELLARVKIHISVNRLEKELLDRNRLLEERVESRTVELSAANESLRVEIAERIQAHDELTRKNEELNVANEKLSAIDEELRANYEILLIREQELRESEERLTLKLDSILSPDIDVSDIELSKILDIPAIQSIMEDFTKLTGLVTAVLDIKGNIIEASGWQDICTKFHRVNEITAKFCTESDLFLAQTLKPGELVEYKCKNNLRDIVTPLYIGDNHLGNIYSGQFFYEDEEVDESVFIAHAERFGFDKDAYLSALHAVPRFSKDNIQTLMKYLVKFTSFISQLSFSNLKLAKLMVEQKKIENALRESEHKFRAIFDQTFQFIGLITLDGTLLEANRTALKFSGIYESDIIGKPFWETPWWTHSRDLQEKLRMAIKVAARGEFVRFEATHPAADGSLHYIDFSIKPVMDEMGHVVLLIPEGRDITERKQAEVALKESEQRLSDIINFLPDATFAIDKMGKIITWNKAMEDMTGMTAGEMVGKDNFEYAIPFYGERRPILIDLIFEKSDPIESRYVHVQRVGNNLIAEAYVPGTYQGKGAELWGIASPLYNSRGEIVGAIELIRDITEAKMAKNSLDRATRKLNLLNSIAFSDVQNSVFSLSGYQDLAKSLVVDEELQQYMDRQTILIRTITESLKFANMYQGLGLKAPAWQNVNQSFLFGISHLDISKLSRTIKVEGLEIYADPLLEYVFFTLAENVILHGKKATEISLLYHESPQSLILVFEDNGEGIHEDMKENIFDRQYEEKKGGGLFLAREILSITDITIKETGEYGEGARFEITVPKGMWRIPLNGL